MIFTDVPSSKRLIQVICAIIWCLLSAGVIFGFSALKVVLIKESVYEYLCDYHTDNTTLFIQDENEIVAKCTLQDLKLNKIFTIAAVLTNVSALLIGFILDNYGPKVCGFIGAGFLYLSCIIFTFSKNLVQLSWFDPYIMGYSSLALGGPFLFISSFSLSNAFPKYSGTILALLTGAFDASSALFLIYQKLYFTLPNFNLSSFFKLYLIVPVFITIAQILLMPWESYQTSSSDLLDVDNENTREVEQTPVSEQNESTPLINSIPHPDHHDLRRRDSVGDALKQPYLNEGEAVLEQNGSGVFGILHGYSAQYQIKTYWFLLICLFSTIQMLRINYFVATIGSQYQYIFGSYELSKNLNSFFDIALPLGGIISIPLIGLLLDNFSTILVLNVLVGISLIIGILGLISNYALAIIGVCLFVGYRPFFYTVISDVCAKVFGFETFGTVYGLIMCISGAINYGQVYLDYATHTVFKMNPFPINLFLIGVFVVISLITLIYVHVQDNLSEFQDCLEQCTCDNTPSQYKIWFWSCSSNCNYYCQQLVSDLRLKNGYSMLQFYGKWPFIVVFGIQEFFSTIFSMGNFIINYLNFKLIYKQYQINNDKEIKLIYFQYLILLGVSMIGWIFSIIFHIKDLPITETLDYFGAFGIILANLNVIVVRYFKLFKQQQRNKLVIWQSFLIMLYIFHILKLSNNWDYTYNMNINMVCGLLAMIFWILHNLNIINVYSKNLKFLQNSIQVIPYENKILNKLNPLIKFLNLNQLYKFQIILFIPIINNLILLCGIFLEIKDFEPWFRLIDAHSLWHLLTIGPNIVWFDWNIWDIEIMKILEKK
ncbi:hypothetical protein KGF54_000846 [Candida jiufengensis]|uniref:uncharacterized protein n=1 Tax=Candida jiufengensis TaxID=497108 RepID=UPI0022255181|nr:uncharacterized protein KGF54_000846 [Candida jiufengensis]KAI5956371.1 hypothetical protein KGF54_000846 [Candida jiufengensis]